MLSEYVSFLGAKTTLQKSKYNNAACYTVYNYTKHNCDVHYNSSLYV